MTTLRLPTDDPELAARPLGGDRRRLAYVASAWRDPMHPLVVQLLREAGWWVYDYRGGRPAPERELDPCRAYVNVRWLREEGITEAVRRGWYANDRALGLATVVVALLPGGTGTAHQLGIARGAGVPAIGYAPGHLTFDVTLVGVTLVTTPAELVAHVDRLRAWKALPSELGAGWCAPLARAA